MHELWLGASAAQISTKGGMLTLPAAPDCLYHVTCPYLYAVSNRTSQTVLLTYLLQVTAEKAS